MFGDVEYIYFVNALEDFTVNLYFIISFLFYLSQVMVLLYYAIWLKIGIYTNLFITSFRISSRDTGKTMVDASLGEIMTTCEKITWLLSEGEHWLKPEYRYHHQSVFYVSCDLNKICSYESWTSDAFKSIWAGLLNDKPYLFF